MRMTFRLLALPALILVAVAACTDKDKVPSGIIPQEKMSHILWDMIQADQYSDTYLGLDTMRTRVKTGTIRLYKEVFQLHQVTPDDFKRSMRFYLDHPDLTRGLFDSAIEIGKRQQTSRYKNQPTPSGGSYGKGNMAAHGAVVPAAIQGKPPVAIPGRGAGVPPRPLPFVPNRQIPVNRADSLRHIRDSSRLHKPGIKMQ